MLISMLLLGLGIFAAWWVDATQSANSQLIAQEVHGIIAAQDLYARMREFRRNLDLFLRNKDIRELEKIQAERDSTQVLLDEASRSAGTADEQELVDVVRRGYVHFFDEYQRLYQEELKQPDSRQQAELSRDLSNLVDEILTDEVLVPAMACVVYNRKVVDTSSAALKETARHMRVGFVLLGLCGALAGVAMGVGIAFQLRRTMVKLQVSVKGVAGRLTEVLGPVSLSEADNMQQLQVALQGIEQHISEVVERLQRQELEILRREQLASLGQIAAALAHELRNPLMPMKMLVQAAVKKGENGPGLSARSLQVLNEEICRMETAIQAFLDFARPPQLERIRFDLRELCRQTLELVTPRAAQQEVVLRSSWPQEPVMMNADAGQIRQVVLNLILNAMDAMPDGGQVDLKITLEKPPATRDPRHDSLSEFDLSSSSNTEMVSLQPENGLVKHSLSVPWELEPSASLCVVSVFDTGTGIPSDLLDRIFEPFVTTKETGNGLGLPTCRRIVQAHGGTLLASNRPDGGAVFTFRLKLE
ncbi:MAG: two-component sensor histidine kinase [Planctomycetaceae bacterium]|nr:two-component sensor histidine kinase [Planctomycetaceae bacterium]